MKTHIQLVGALHLTIGVMGAFGGLVAVFVLGAVGAVGGLAAGIEEGIGTGLLAGGVLGVIALVVLACTALASLPSLFGGWGLLTGKKWGPAVALVASFFHVWSVPFGTALAAYTVWTTMSAEGQAELGLTKV